LTKLSEYFEKAVFLSDGYLGLSGAAELCANTLAREISPLRLTGNWGSELLRGVRAFKFVGSGGEILHPDLQEFVEQARESFSLIQEISSKSFAPFYQAPYQSYGRHAIERSQLIPRTPFLDNELVKLVYQAPETFNGFALAEAIIARLRPALLKIPTDRGYLGNDSKLIRVGRRFYREALFKAEYWVGNRAPDWLVNQNKLQSIFQIEKQILGRHKFYHLRKWVRENLSEKIRYVLMQDRNFAIAPYIDEKVLTTILDDHLNRANHNTIQIDNIMTLALTAKTLLKES
jgi:asparagine synthase (glutamine-hydrolysing)